MAKVKKEYVSRVFPKEQLKEILWDGEEGYEVISDEMVDKSRWSIHKYLIFKDITENKFYGVDYSVGATESQDEGPFEYDGDEITCHEVVPKEVTTIKYVMVEIQ